VRRAAVQDTREGFSRRQNAVLEPSQIGRKAHIKDILDTLRNGAPAPARRLRKAHRSAHARGKLPRGAPIELLLDKGSFEESTCSSSTVSVEFVTGQDQCRRRRPSPAGARQLRTTFVSRRQGFSRCSAIAFPETHAQKIVKMPDIAMKRGRRVIGPLRRPVVARIQEWLAALWAILRVPPQCIASAVIPQMSVIMGPCAGGDVYSPHTDFIFILKQIPAICSSTGSPTREDRHHGRSCTAERNSARLRPPPVPLSPTCLFETDVETAVACAALIVIFLPANNPDVRAVMADFDDYRTGPDISPGPADPRHPTKPYT